MSHVFDVTEETFQQDVVERSKEVPVVVDFWGPHCGPCRVLGPKLEQLAEEADGKWVLAKVNTTENQQLAFDFRIQGIPAVKAIRDGEVIHEFVGALPMPEIQRWLDLFVPNDIDALYDEGRERIEDGDLAAATDCFVSMGDDPRAQVGLAQVALQDDRPNDAAEHLDAIPERLIDKVVPEYSHAWVALHAHGVEEASFNAALDADKNDRQARFDRAMFNAARGEYDSAFEDLIWIVMVDRGFRDDLARIAAVRLFDVVGIHSELANTWRSKLGQAMY